MMEEEDHNGSAQEDTQQDRGLLYRKLKEAEKDGAATAEQVSDLRESVLKLSVSGKLSAANSSVLPRQKKLLLQKLQLFEASNGKLRNVLREQPRTETEMTLLSEEKETLLITLADCEAEIAFLVLELQEKEKEADELSKRVAVENENVKKATNLSKTLEDTRNHLQGQLRTKETENNHLALQIKKLQKAIQQLEVELSRLKEEVAKHNQQAEADRDALQRATQAQKERVEQGEEMVAEVNVQLLDVEERLSEALREAETWQCHHSRELDNKCKLEFEVSLLKRRIEDVTKNLKAVEVNGQDEKQPLLDQITFLNTENSESREENQTLQAAASGVEEKLLARESELQQAKDSIKQYETLLDGYKTQVVKTRTEADEYANQLAEAEQEAQALLGRQELEIAEVREELMGRLAELEALPDALRRAELQLQEVRERDSGQERRGLELNTIMTELRLKVETQGSQIELVKQKNKLLMEENQQLQQHLRSLMLSATPADNL